MDKVKALVIAAISTLMSWLGILAVPVFLMVGCNIIDYITGIWAAGYRTENVNSYKGPGDHQKSMYVAAGSDRGMDRRPDQPYH